MTSVLTQSERVSAAMDIYSQIIERECNRAKRLEKQAKEALNLSDKVELQRRSRAIRDLVRALRLLTYTVEDTLTK